MENPISVQAQPSNSKKAVVVVLFILGILGIGFIIFAFILNSQKYGGEVSKLVAQQTELTRVIGIGKTHDSSNLLVRNYAVTVEQSLVSSNKLLSGLNGGEPKTSEIALYTDTGVEADLNNAASLNNFNETFLALIASQLGDIITQAKTLESRADEDDRAIVTPLVKQLQALINNAP